ncbi:MAG: hypothetical protein C3F15_13615 [Holophagae bacterium]|nr:MAG: hypothetical protein C3F15_13615 [Holophagae bacterium]
MLQLFARSLSGRAAATAVVFVLAAATAAAQTFSGQVQRGGSDVCCLTNFRFTGPCEVTIGAGESCSDVLAYLNNFQAAGRQYCGNTIIRGGWTQVRCGSTAGGVVISPDAVNAYEPSNITGATTMEPIGTTSFGTVSRTDATFITPIEASKAASAAEPGLIDL